MFNNQPENGDLILCVVNNKEEYRAIDYVEVFDPMLDKSFRFSVPIHRAWPVKAENEHIEWFVGDPRPYIWKG